MDVVQFRRKLRELRDAAGLSQKELADKAGLSQRAISAWETGDHEPGWGAILALAAALSVDCRAFQPDGGAPAPRPRLTGSLPRQAE